MMELQTWFTLNSLVVNVWKMLAMSFHTMWNKKPVQGESHSAQHTARTPWYNMLPHQCIVHNDVLLLTIFTYVNLARLKRKILGDGRRMKHVGAILI